jgi:hypothetical protein
MMVFFFNEENGMYKREKKMYKKRKILEYILLNSLNKFFKKLMDGYFFGLLKNVHIV